MATSPRNVFLFNIDITIDAGTFMGRIATGESLQAPRAFTVPSALSPDDRFVIFEQIVAKISKARRVGQNFITILVSDTDHIVADPPLPPASSAPAPAAAVALQPVQPPAPLATPVASTSVSNLPAPQPATVDAAEAPEDGDDMDSEEKAVPAKRERSQPKAKPKARPTKAKKPTKKSGRNK
jgi:hypothetical protein